MLITSTEIAVWTTPAGVPERLFWDGARYLVTDTPTPLEPNVSFVTHPPAATPAWRFQATAADGRSFVFDIRLDAARGRWQLLRAYE
ncbi:hypothetical protein ITJ66_02610 [Plantibacter sp. VKM Ac-2885]|jgi:hypothetical protein|uniref:Uncharacterized protein n=1 Tax=Plantibacter flavus TaxID=150123 RepID=A0A1S7B5G4_9MICO|nr:MULTISPECIES: hypothetical protein [Plantibacter]AQX78883.1 hypothetical protein BWO91_01720 [Plantibacter flavus]MBD8537308.1 hypothetical protein [Plantibacter sp. CFBP 13570]MBF4511365.1 hypothetical protein [Plantibacter sp. VKM Ac-2885]MBF4564194.1 hypothetical protein [Plantibacter sp. VKM Ac-2876]NUJ88277.1 hypothetical protein [Plantibacter sp. MCCC 1A11337]